MMCAAIFRTPANEPRRHAAPDGSESEAAAPRAELAPRRSQAATPATVPRRSRRIAPSANRASAESIYTVIPARVRKGSGLIRPPRRSELRAGASLR